jgi:DNA-binding response OmpR family regulator
MTDRLRILLVEDDEGLRYAMRVALEHAELEVDEAADGREAVQAITARANTYAAVILDLLLPNIHGSSVLSHIARTAPRLPVFAVTGFPDRILFSDPGDRQVVKAIFTKPVDPVDVAAYVRSRCSRIKPAPSA